MAKVTGQQLARDWGVPVKHAYYGEDGRWFHQLKRFPGALFDPNGYVLFETAAGYQAALPGQIKQDINGRDGISRLPGYVRVVRDGQVTLPQQSQRTSFEKAQRAKQTFLEGELKETILSRPERDPAARAACIGHYGLRCTVCDLLLSERYGDLGLGYIHVHHLVPFTGLQEAREVDPVRDMRPVCPNCHAMLHRTTPPRTLDELQAIVRQRGA